MLHFEYIYEHEEGHLLWQCPYTNEYGYLGKIPLCQLYNVIALSIPEKHPYELTFTPAIINELVYA